MWRTGRLTMTSAALGISMALVTSAMADAAGTARGVVFEDLNGDGRRDPGEPGIPAVMVSNQEDVVLTDDQGRYSIPVSDDTIIFVTKPAGYRLPVNEHRLPQFFYIHKPKGSPPLYHGGVAPTGPLPESIDFPLTKAAEPEKFRAIVLGDPQPETSQEVQYIRDDVLSELVGTDAAFGITLGDIVSDQPGLYGGYNAAVAWVGVPFFNIIGNHDSNYDAADDRDSDETFHRVFGLNYYSWDYAKVHFVALDSVKYLGAATRRYEGEFGARQLNWLAADLANVPSDRLVVLCMHIPILDAAKRDCADRIELLKVLSGRPRVLALAGHTHLQEHLFFGPADGWTGPGTLHQLNTATVCGTWWSGPKDVRGIPVADNRDGVPNGYSIVTFDGNDYRTEYKAAGFARDYRMRIYPPGTIEPQSWRSLLVNVFDGSSRCTVEYSIDGGEFLPMTQAPQKDPWALSLYTGVRNSRKPWGAPRVTQHIWAVELAEALPRGTHVVTVRVTDHFERVYEQSMIFGR